MASFVALKERAEELWFDVAGPRGWRSVAGPGTFALLSIALLVYDHLQQKVPPILFWLALVLIVTVFVWVMQTSRKQFGALEAHSRKALSDDVTGLDNRRRLEDDIRAAVTIPGERRVLLVFDLDGLQTYNDRFGYAAGDELLRRVAQALARSATPLGGTAYRVDDRRLALLVP